MIKKTKKPKDKEAEEEMKEAEENEKKKADSETEATNEEKQNKVTTQENEDDSSYGTPNVVNMPSGEQKLLIRQDTAAARRVSRTSAVPQELDSSRSTNNEEKIPEKERAKGY